MCLGWFGPKWVQVVVLLCSALRRSGWVYARALLFCFVLRCIALFFSLPKCMAFLDCSMYLSCIICVDLAVCHRGAHRTTFLIKLYVLFVSLLTFVVAVRTHDLRPFPLEFLGDNNFASRTACMQSRVLHSQGPPSPPPPPPRLALDLPPPSSSSAGCWPPAIRMRECGSGTPAHRGRRSQRRR